MTCDSCAPYIYGNRNITIPPIYYWTPNSPPALPKVASTDYIEGALNERKRIVEALKNAGHEELAKKLDRGEL